MNNYKLIKKMQRIRAWYNLSALDQVVFYELINVCNARGWKEIFCCTNTTLYQSLSISENTLIKSRNNLIKAGLISYKPGKTKRQPGSYSLWLEVATGTPLAGFPDHYHSGLEKRQTDQEKENEENEPIPEGNTEGITEAIPEGNTESNADYIKTQTKKKINKEREEENKKVKEKFEKFRMAYPGCKRGAETEFNLFRKKHRDYSEVVDLLLPALEQLKKWRAERQTNGFFVPEYPHLSTWINQRRWEIEFEITNTPTDENKPTVIL